MTSEELRKMMEGYEQARRAALAARYGLFANSGFVALLEKLLKPIVGLAKDAYAEFKASIDDNAGMRHDTPQLRPEHPRDALIRIVMAACPQPSQERTNLIQHIKAQPIEVVRTTLAYITQQPQSIASMAATPQGLMMLMQYANEQFTRNVLTVEQMNGSGFSFAKALGELGLMAKSAPTPAGRRLDPEEPPVYSARAAGAA